MPDAQYIQVYTCLNSTNHYEVQVWMHGTGAPRKLISNCFYGRRQGYDWATTWLDKNPKYSTIERKYE